MRVFALSLMACALAAGPVLAQQTAAPQTQSPARGVNQDPSVTVPMIDAKGNSVGHVQIRQLAQGTVLIAELRNLPPGPHGFHIHERGACDPPQFQSAGEHYNPANAEHGFDNPNGYHAGDLPNIYVTPQGTAMAEFHTTQVTLTLQARALQARAPQAGAPQAGSSQVGSSQAGASAAGAAGPFPLLDGDGSAIMIHAAPDDYRDSDSAGGRIACGVVKAP
ncbi:MAG: superoxide dismutase family protein [Alphaproteobacteria bacterium]